MLLELKEGDRFRFRCHTGHAYSVESLLAAINEGIEESLWTSIRALEEGGMLLHRMAEHLKGTHDGAEAGRLKQRADEARRQAKVIQELAAERGTLSIKD